MRRTCGEWVRELARVFSLHKNTTHWVRLLKKGRLLNSNRNIRTDTLSSHEIRSLGKNRIPKRTMFDVEQGKECRPLPLTQTHSLDAELRKKKRDAMRLYETDIWTRWRIASNTARLYIQYSAFSWRWQYTYFAVVDAWKLEGTYVQLNKSREEHVVEYQSCEPHL